MYSGVTKGISSAESNIKQQDYSTSAKQVFLQQLE